MTTFDEAARIAQGGYHMTVQKMSPEVRGITNHPCKCGEVATLKVTLPDFTQEFTCQKHYEELHQENK